MPADEETVPPTASDATAAAESPEASEQDAAPEPEAGEAGEADALSLPPMLKYLDAQVEELRDQLPSAVEALEPSAVHRSRVATRRLKAGLALLKPLLAGKRRKQFGKLGRDIRRALGPLRDLDVMRGHLDELPANRFTNARTFLGDRFDAAHAQSRKDLKGKLKPIKLLGKLGRVVGPAPGGRRPLRRRRPPARREPAPAARHVRRGE